MKINSIKTPAIESKCIRYNVPPVIHLESYLKSDVRSSVLHNIFWRKKKQIQLAEDIPSVKVML